MNSETLYDLSPLASLMGVGLLLALGPLLWVVLRQRHAGPARHLHALTLVTLFLTFDLILFGAFTRLSDSGLGCPDWPGCYGNASPIGAREEIASAQHALPSGPVTHSKAWIEMIHRYLATGVGVLIIAMTALAWWQQRTISKVANEVRPFSPWLPTLTLVWVCIQGAFGALTVTMKLFPAIVSLHLLGGYTLLALLTWQAVRSGLSMNSRVPAKLPQGIRTWVGLSLALLVLQAASGAWVSTNYAVLACTEFPMCQASWWPQMNFEQGFTLWRHLGLMPDGTHIGFDALTAIHFVHRLLALFTALNLLALAAYLWGYSTLTRPTRFLLGLLLLQLVTGISNVVLGWPLLAALLHTGGAGALVGVLVWLLATTQRQNAAQSSHAYAQRMVL